MLKYGRKPPKNHPALQLADLLAPVPYHPPTQDNLAVLKGWQMLGNDQYGDCVAVTWANVRRLMANLAGTAEYPNLTQVITFYKTQNPGFPSQDDGMDIQTALEDLVANGGPDGRHAVAFAKVDHTNPDEVKAAISIFGYVWTGITVLQANQDEFGKGLAWDYVKGSPVDGGHSVVTGGYYGLADDDERFITWAQETGFTDNFWSHLVEEAWVVIWPEHLGTAAFQAGIDPVKLAAAYQAITGKTLVLPTPVTPPPPPVAATFPGATDKASAELLHLADLHGTDWVGYLNWRFGR